MVFACDGALRQVRARGAHSVRADNSQQQRPETRLMLGILRPYLDGHAARRAVNKLRGHSLVRRQVCERLSGGARRHSAQRAAAACQKRRT